MSAKLIVILGVTGIQGGSVARLFQTLPGWRIRGVTRNPNKPSCDALRESGVELVAGDLDDPASLDRAFQGAHAIFSVTDFWQFLQDPATYAAAEQSGRLPNQVAMDREIQHGKNVADVAAKHLATLERLVVSTLSDSEKWSGGKIKWNLHFDGKARYTQYLKDTYPELARRTSYVQMGFYLSNVMMSGPLAALAPKKNADGTYVWSTFSGPAAGNDSHPLPYVDAFNDTGYFVKALVEAKEGGIDLLGYCELLTQRQFVDRWAQILGVKATVQSRSTEDMTALGLPEFLALEISDSGKFVTTYGWVGADSNVKHPKDIGVELDRLAKVDEWIRQQDWSSIL